MAEAAARTIAVCADDYGLHPAVNEAVLALAARGLLSATSCMTGAPAWRPGAAGLRALDPTGIDVGLHLDLTEHPFDAGLRKPLNAWLVRSYAGAVPRAVLRREIETQLDAFEQALGRAPAYVDGHQHVHQLPGVRSVLLEVLARRHDGARPWLRSTRRPGAGAGRKAWVIERLGSRGLARLAEAGGFAQNGHLLGVYGFSGDDSRYLALLRQWLAAARSGDLLMCHPATRDVPGDAIAAARCVEFGVLAGAGFPALLASEGIAVRPLTAGGRPS